MSCAVTVAARSISQFGCRTIRLSLAWRRRWRRAGEWCETTSPLLGGRWPTRPATRSTSPARRAATDERSVESAGMSNFYGAFTLESYETQLADGTVTRPLGDDPVGL